MDDLRRLELSTEFQYKGRIVRALFYYKGNTNLVHSWDVVIGRFNVSKSARDERYAMGITDEDMSAIDAMIKSHVDHREGRR